VDSELSCELPDFIVLVLYFVLNPVAEVLEINNEFSSIADWNKVWKLSEEVMNKSIYICFPNCEILVNLGMIHDKDRLGIFRNANYLGTATDVKLLLD
jgi:hypothetical protein